MSDTNRRMVKGAAWMVAFKLIERSIGLVSTLILARVLFPADFGLVAMATTIVGALELLSSFSFDLALIQNQAAKRQHYDTAWTFNVLFGLFNALAMIALAAPAAGFYGEPKVEGVLYALAGCSFIQGFDNIGVVAFQKDMELHKEFMLGLSKKLVGFVVTISLAFILKSYWALVIGIFFTRLTGLVLSYKLHPFRPRLSLAAAGDLFHFSKWLLLNNLLIFLNNRGTDFVIGKVSGAQALGLYSVAYEVANLPTTELVFPISRAVFPGYARLAGDPEKLRTTFLGVNGLLALLTIPAGAGIGLIAEPLVHVLLGPKWADAAPLIQVLAAFGIVRALHGPNGSIFLALGKPRIIATLQCVQLSIAIGLMLLLVPQWGAIGAAWSILAGACTAMISSYTLVLRKIQLPFAKLLGAIWRPLVATIVMALVVNTLSNVWHIDLSISASAQRLIALILAGAITYTSTLIVCWMLMGKPAGAELQIVTLATSRIRRIL